MANERWPVLTPAGKVNKKKPLIEGLLLITGDNTQSKSNGTTAGYRTTTGMNHIQITEGGACWIGLLHLTRKPILCHWVVFVNTLSCFNSCSAASLA